MDGSAAGFAQGWNDAITRAIETAIPARLGLEDALDEWRALKLSVPIEIPAAPPHQELAP